MNQPKALRFDEQSRLGRIGVAAHLLALVVIALVGGVLFAGLVAGLGVLWTLLAGESPGILGRIMRAPPAAWQDVPLLARLLFMALNLGFVAVWFFAVWAALAWVHRRPLRTALTGAGRVRWRHLLVSFALMLLLCLVALGLDGMLWSEGLRLSFEPRGFFFMLPWMLALLALQVAAEELVFRGYILQTLRLLLPAPAVWLLVSAGFALLHGFNPEVAKEPLVMAYFLLVGGYLTALVFRNNGLETALGVHLAANVLALIVVSNDLSDYPVATILHAESTNLPATLAASAVVLALHWLLLPHALRRADS